METKKINLLGNVATLVTPIRLILGWQFFSAFLRRMLSAPEKLDPTSPAYMGHAFNHFLPHSLFIKPLIKYLIIHPDILYFFLVTFTIIEGLVGIGLLLGFFTRIAALGATGLSLGILLGSGWLGSTCVDEWQIGIAGIGTGLVILSLGAGVFSLDQLFLKIVNQNFYNIFHPAILISKKSRLSVSRLLFHLLRC
ncbi:MAG: TQO small subunit DoxD [Deltaproteobacteria bacterium]